MSSRPPWRFLLDRKLALVATMVGAGLVVLGGARSGWD
ncbi:MAG: hypothetical protein JWP32_2523, partial [Schumannella sp.]|nr:hypothetical protein [Schumannella sp.]